MRRQLREARARWRRWLSQFDPDRHGTRYRGEPASALYRRIAWSVRMRLVRFFIQYPFRRR